MSKPVKVPKDTHETLTNLAQSTKMTMGDIIGYLVDLCEKWDMLDPDWLEGMIQEKLDDFLSKHDIEFSKKLQLERTRTVNKAKLTAFNKYLDVLPPEARKEYLENILGSTGEENFLENLSNYTMFTIDGVRKFLEADPDGKPIVAGANMNNIVPCDNGYHFIGNFCKCGKWRNCRFRSKEYQNYLAKTDPNMRRPETRRFVGIKENWREKARRDYR
jgi:hypothetical protein